MAIIFYSGLPKTGKTASATYLAVKEYKKHNRFISKYLEVLKEYDIKELKNLNVHKEILKKARELKINRIYSNYPILLDVKRNIFSNTVKPLDLDMRYQFPKGCTIILDEFQRYYDSREFKKFPKGIGTLMQHHRHGDIENIILISQHPRRVDNKIRDLSEIFRKYRMFIKLPLLPVIFTSYTNYYEFEDYGLYNKVDKEHRTYDYDNHFKFMLVKNVFTRYESKYFSVIFETLPNMNNTRFIKKSLTLDEINNVGIDLSQ